MRWEYVSSAGTRKFSRFDGAVDAEILEENVSEAGKAFTMQLRNSFAGQARTILVKCIDR